MNKDKLYYIVLFFCCLLGHSTLEAQIVIRPNSVNPFFSFNQGTDVQLINASNNTFEGVLQVRLDDNSSNSIFQIQSLPFTIQGGEIIGSNKIQWENGIEYSDNAFAKMLMQNGTIPNGQFVYCYRFIEVGTGMSIGNYCQENSMANFQLPQLVYPFNNQTIYTTNPLLTWRPPIPFVGSQINYSLVLVERMEGQSAIEALNSNLPLIEKYRIKTEALPYPVSGIPLKVGNQYTWQVSAFWDNQEMGKTQIWNFTVGENEVEEEETSEAYCGTKNKLDGAHYSFKKDIYFSYDNHYDDRTLNYTMKALGEERKDISALPEITLKPGLNHIKIETKGLGLRKKTIYLIEIIDSRKKKHFLEFKIVRK